MAQVMASADMRSISELESRGSELVAQVSETHRPVVLTRHGRGVAVVLSLEEYESLNRAARNGAILEALREGERDVAAGRVLSHEEMRAKWLPEDPEA